MQKGKNLFDKNKILNNTSLDIYSGMTQTTSNRATSPYVYVMSNKTYTISENGAAIDINMVQYDENKNYITGGVIKGTFRTTTTTKYVRFYAGTSNIQIIQLEQGSTATSYEEYIEPKTYILNDNNVYEEFMKKEELNYNLKDKQTNNTQGSWKPIQLEDNENFIVFIIKGSNYEDCRTIPKELVKKYSASSPLILKFNNTIIAQLAWNAGNMVEYIWTSGYTIEHYAY